MADGHISSADGTDLTSAMSRLPVAMGVIDRNGRLVSIGGGIADVIRAEGLMCDPAGESRWRGFDELGAELSKKDWPSQRALRGEMVLQEVRMTHLDDDGVTRPYLTCAAPVDMPDGTRGCVFLVRRAASEAATAEKTDPAAAASDGLTPREKSVLRLFSLGYSRKEIGGRLGIAVKTAEFYQTSAMRKMSLRNRPDVVRFAISQGWMTPEEIA